MHTPRKDQLSKGLSLESLNLHGKRPFGTPLKNISINALSAVWSASHMHMQKDVVHSPLGWNKCNSAMQTLEFISTRKKKETLIFWKAVVIMPCPENHTQYLRNLMTHGPPKEGAFFCYWNPKEDKDIM